MARRDSPSQSAPERVVATNRRARHDYEVVDHVEAGIELLGTEVKALREVGCDLTGAYAVVEGGEVFLKDWEIPPYPHAHHANHEAKRVRRLLLHRREIRKWEGRARERGFTIVPLRVYFRAGRAKVEIALARGRRQHDRRRRSAEKEARREIRQALGRR